MRASAHGRGLRPREADHRAPRAAQGGRDRLRRGERVRATGPRMRRDRRERRRIRGQDLGVGLDDRWAAGAGPERGPSAWRRATARAAGRDADEGTGHGRPHPCCSKGAILALGARRSGRDVAPLRRSAGPANGQGGRQGDTPPGRVRSGRGLRVTGSSGAPKNRPPSQAPSLAATGAGGAAPPSAVHVGEPACAEPVPAGWFPEAGVAAGAAVVVVGEQVHARRRRRAPRRWQFFWQAPWLQILLRASVRPQLAAVTPGFDARGGRTCRCRACRRPDSRKRPGSIAPPRRRPRRTRRSASSSVRKSRTALRRSGSRWALQRHLPPAQDSVRPQVRISQAPQLRQVHSSGWRAADASGLARAAGRDALALPQRIPGPQGLRPRAGSGWGCSS
jgi:hypothetical protein